MFIISFQQYEETFRLGGWGEGAELSLACASTKPVKQKCRINNTYIFTATCNLSFYLRSVRSLSIS